MTFNICTKKWKKVVASLVTLLVLLSTGAPISLLAATGVPKVVNYQGRLLDASGNLLGGSSGTNYCFKFAVYDSLTSGTKLWPSSAPATTTVSVKNGIFSYGIGSGDGGGDATISYNFQDDDSVFLEVAVAPSESTSCAPVDDNLAWETLSPRKQVYASGYAVNAGTVLGYTPAQSASGSQIPVLANGNLHLGGTNPQVNATSSNNLVFQGDSSLTGDIHFFDSGNVFTAATKRFGIGTTSPYAMLSVAGETVAAYFTATTSTASSFPYASTTMVTATTASTTDLIVSGNTTFQALSGSTQCLQVNSSGVLSGFGTGCGGGDAFAWTPTTNYGAVANSTSTTAWFQNGLQASSTAHLVYASSTALSVSGALYWDSGTQGRLWFSGASGALSDDANLFTDGARLAVGTSTLNNILNVEAESPTQGLVLFNSNNLVLANLIAKGGDITTGAFNLFSGAGASTVSLLGSGVSYFNGGNVGIGTTTPGQKLSVAGDILGNNIIGSYFTGTSTTASTLAGALTSSGIVTGSSFVASSASATSTFAGGLAIETSGFVYDYSSGKVGIGTTAPGEALQVVGNIKLSGNIKDETYTGTSIALDNDLTISANRDVFIDTGVVFKDGGNVGIGTTTPWGKLSVTQTGTGGAPAFIVEDIASPDGTPFVITEAGDVGLGVVAPAAKLHVLNITDGSIRVDNSLADSTNKIGRFTYGHYNSAEEPVFGFGGGSQTDNNTVNIGGGSGVFNAATKLSFYTAADTTTLTGTERMTIDSGGLVGIGTTSPAALASIGGNLFVGASTAGGTQGRVGIGESSPTYALVINGTGANDVLQWKESGTAIGYAGTGAQLVTGAATTDYGFQAVNNMVFAAGGTGEDMRITSAGNVGIGITTPTALLNLDSSTAFGTGNTQAGEDTLYLSNNTSGAGVGNFGASIGFAPPYATTLRSAAIATVQTGSDADQAGLAFFTHPSDSAIDIVEAMRIDHSGNVGIGTTSPWTKLAVTGADSGFTSSVYNTQGAATGGGLYVQTRWNTADNYIARFTTNSGASEVLAIKGNGNVGIGETAPGSRLAVSGNATIGASYDTTAAPTNGLIVEGNVGIGTAAPSTVLSVVSDSSNEGFNVKHSNLTQGVAIGWDSIAKVGTNANSTLDIDAKGTGDLVLQSNATGNVGIGTNAPDTKLHVNGAYQMGSATVDTGDFTMIKGAQTGDPQFSISLTGDANADTTLSADSGDIILNSAGATNQLFLEEGTQHVGIGTSTPGKFSGTSGDLPAARTVFHVDASGNAPGVNQIAHFAVTGTTAGGAPIAGAFEFLDLGAATNSKWLAWVMVNGKSHVRTVNDSGSLKADLLTYDLVTGNVGIGTTTPWGKLSVNGAGTGTGVALAVADSGNKPHSLFYDNGTVAFGTTTEHYGKLTLGTGTMTSSRYPASSGKRGALFYSSGTIMEASSGNHPVLANTILMSPVVNNAAGTASEVATLYIEGAPTGGATSTPYALLVDSGKVRIDESLEVGVYDANLTRLTLKSNGDNTTAVIANNGTGEGLQVSTGGSNSDIVAHFYGSGAYGVMVTANNKLHIGTLASASGNDLCYSTTDYVGWNTPSTCSSSERYKENIADLTLGLSTLRTLRPVTFDWKADGAQDFGFVAEEVEAVDPLFATYYDGQIEGVRYKQLTALITKSIQELTTVLDVTRASKTKTALTVDAGGNVGIGTTTPGAALNIVGALCVDSTATPTCEDADRDDGTIYAVATAITGIDLAERYPTLDTLAPGDIVMLDESNPVYVKKAREGGIPLGIVSTQPGILLGGYGSERYAGVEQVALALSGRVPTKVNLDGGAIAIGDRVTLSLGDSGVGMRATSTDQTTIGIALEPFDGTIASSPANISTYSRTGNIAVFVNLESGRLRGVSGAQVDSQWLINQETGAMKLAEALHLDLQGKDILNVRSIVSAGGKWSLSESGLLVAEEVRAKRVRVESGITIRDRITGEYGCVLLENGVLVTEPGECPLSPASSTMSQSTPAVRSNTSDASEQISGEQIQDSGFRIQDGEIATDSPTTYNLPSTTPGLDTEPPKITLNGNNPATVSQGDQFIDPGATVTDDKDDNLGIKVGGDIVDTSTTGTYIIAYDATDSDGNKAEQETRTVTVEVAESFTKTQTSDVDSRPSEDSGQASDVSDPAPTPTLESTQTSEETTVPEIGEQTIAGNEQLEGSTTEEAGGGSIEAAVTEEFTATETVEG